MIVKMEKITLLCLADEREEALEKLRGLGAMHITPVTSPRSTELDESLNKLRQAKSLQVILDSHRKNSSKHVSESAIIESDNVLDTINTLLQEKKRLTTTIEDINREKLLIEPYGNFDPELVNEISKKGLHIKLFAVSKKETAVAPEDTYLFVINQNSKKQYIVIAGKNDFAFEGDECSLPDRPLTEVIKDIETAKSELNHIESQLTSLSAKPDAIKNIILELESDVEFIEAKEGMGASGKIAYIQGFCPADIVDSVVEASRKHGWGIITNEPTSDDKVPTLIKTPAWVKPIKSLFTLLDILPGYNEVDIRSVFFLFFGLFFAMLVSDAGYGLLFLAATIILRVKLKNAPPEPFRLVGILSVCAIIWGVITGSYFGIEDLPAPLSGLKIAWLKSEEHIMMLAFVIGAIHLTIAHAWRALLTINSTRALAQVGWICLTWTMFFLSRDLILGIPLPSFFTGLLITGLTLVAVFMTPFKHLKTEWADHVMLPFDVVGNFADLVSYVRLFAVGSASLAVASAFNELAIGDGIDSIFAGIIAVIILFLGHSLNIILCLMSILVHGVRLNTLEFSGHIGLEWSGFKYKPFEEQTAGKK